MLQHYIREFEQQRELSVKGVQTISSHKNDPTEVEAEAASSEIANELEEVCLYILIISSAMSTCMDFCDLQSSIVMIEILQDY